MLTRIHQVIQYDLFLQTGLVSNLYGAVRKLHCHSVLLNHQFKNSKLRERIDCEAVKVVHACVRACVCLCLQVFQPDESNMCLKSGIMHCMKVHYNFLPFTISKVIN